MYKSEIKNLKYYDKKNLMQGVLYALCSHIKGILSGVVKAANGLQ
jgi:hypothetical protein